MGSEMCIRDSCNRMQRVVSNCSSSWISACSGVPQGSVLGPILFCLVVDSLLPACANTKILKYADDIVLLHYERKLSDDNLQLEWDSLVIVTCSLACVTDEAPAGENFDCSLTLALFLFPR